MIQGYDLTKEQTEKFDIFYKMLVEWNKKFNLTAITDRDEVEVKHFADSLSLSDFISSNDIKSMIDVGTGAGFPGIPLKIMFPDLKVTLLDSLNKRVSFLNAVIDELGFDHIEAVHGRAEELSGDENYREQFDLSVSRAVANLSSLSELCIPFVKIGGHFVSYKSEKAVEEIERAQNAIHILGADELKMEDYSLDVGGVSNNRTLIILRKVSQTPDKYPRRAGIPIKKPL